MRVRLVLALLLSISTSAACLAASPTVLNVKDFGAVGDGKADDTSAILRAIAAGKTRKLPVSFPKGDYRVTKTLTIEQQSLTSAEPGAWCADAMPMASFVVAHKTGPVVIMKDASSIHGFGFIFDINEKGKIPPAIQLSGNGISITNVRVQYGWDGIIADGESNIGRLNIENVFMVSPAGTGLYVTRTLDIPTIRNVEVWNNVGRPKVTAFKFGQNDGLRASELFAFGVAFGYDFVDTKYGGTWGIFSNCGTDATEVAIRADGKSAHRLGFTGGYFWDHWQGLLLKNPNTDIRVSGVDFQSNGAPVIECHAVHSAIITGCNFTRAFENPPVPFIDLEGGDAVAVTGCRMDAWSPILSLGPNVKQASIQSNVFAPSKHPRTLKDDRAKDADIVISNNAGMAAQ